jgi:SNF2 family DNA or RNA helicase
MGLGKTVAALTAINKLMFEELDVDRVLIISPKRVTESVWAQECVKWDHTRHLKVSKIIGTPKQRRQAIFAKADIYLISRDNIAWLCGLYGGSTLPFDMLVIDESSSFKNPKSIRFKALRAVQPSFNRVVILTGTPAPNGLIDLWSQIYLLDRGERLGRTVSMYQRDYFRPGQTNGHVVYSYRLIKGSEELIHAKIGDICISMKAKDYLDLPERIDNTIRIEFPPALQERYNKFEKEQVLRLFSDSEDEISAVNAAALSNKLLQFANGAVYDENKDWHEQHTLKLDAAEEIVDTANGQPVLIAWTFRHDMYRLKERLKKYSPRELKTDIDVVDWNAGKIQVLLMHPASGGHGLNLQSGGNIIVWFGQTWSLELEQQLNARLDRQGQTKNVVINRLIAVNTIDTDVVKSLNAKDKKQDGLMVAIKARVAKYI